jgi:hypothetical protein
MSRPATDGASACRKRGTGRDLAALESAEAKLKQKETDQFCADLMESGFHRVAGDRWPINLVAHDTRDNKFIRKVDEVYYLIGVGKSSELTYLVGQGMTAMRPITAVAIMAGAMDEFEARHQDFAATTDVRRLPEVRDGLVNLGPANDHGEIGPDTVVKSPSSSRTRCLRH